MNNDQFGKEQHWNKAILKIPEAKLGDNGLYRCLPYNDIGQAEESSVRIMVGIMKEMSILYKIF